MDDLITRLTAFVRDLGPASVTDCLRTYPHAHPQHRTEALAYDLRALLSALSTEKAKREALEKENETLRLELLGGEDAPGFAASLPLATVVQSARDFRYAQRDRAEAAEAALAALRSEAREVVGALVALFANYRKSDLSHSDAHACLVRYPTWDRAAAFLTKLESKG